MTTPPTVLLATRSEDKVREIRQILGPVFRGRVITLVEAGVPPSPEEDDLEAFDTFLDNAHAKAAYFLQLAGLPTLADDSGICVAALHGAPGVHSKRFASEPALSGLALDDANNLRLLHELRDMPPERRSAYYTCAAVLHLLPREYLTTPAAPGPDKTSGERHPPATTRCAAVGTCTGAILHQPRGTGGFGYDPLFLDPLTGLSFGELDPDRKNRVSHRARAFRALAANLPTF
jgi:XTP/dITP diphosphohydrolase